MAKNDKDINKKKSHYFKDMKAELKKVVWPSRKQTANNTVAVIVFALVLAIIVFLLDVCFDAINKHAVTPLQEKITSSFNTTTDDKTSDEGEEKNVTSENEENSTNVEVEPTTDGEEKNENASTETNTESKEE